MIKHCTTLLFFLFVYNLGLHGQNADQRVLFSVQDKPVTVEEFTYIYSKTNGEKADFSRASLQEYLDLYTKFKLKVARAHEMQLDTVSSLQEELAGYRRQLSDSYLIDRAIGDQLLLEAYEHAQQDVDISHILVAIKSNPTPADTLAAYQKAMETLARLRKGADFATVAKEVSDDRYSKEFGGRVGYTTALYPAGLHKLEYAAYKAPIGTVTGPVRTNAGYHLLLVHDRRPARGEIEAAHILIRKDEANPALAKTRIDSIYNALQGGADFGFLAMAVSQDKRSAETKGYLGFFGISRFERPFEDAAFALTADDTYTRPVETSVGWHIIKRISRKEIQPFAIEKPRLESRVRQDARFEEGKRELLRKIRSENNFTENHKLLDQFIATLNDTFPTFRWKAPEPSAEVLFSLGKSYKVSLGDFTEYLGKSTRQRVTMAREGDASTIAHMLYATFVDDQLMKFEESQLEQRYPEFRNLMREYEEGILLFEATKIEVWDRAAQDSVGLQAYYQKNTDRYRWMPRAKATVFRIGTAFQEEAESIRAFAKNHTPEEVLAKFNTPEVKKVVIEEATFEKNRSTELSDVAWEVGAVSSMQNNERTRSLKFVKVTELMPEMNKSLAEARGYVIADYQDELERQWVEDLRKRYTVNIDRKVFDSLVK